MPIMPCDGHIILPLAILPNESRALETRHEKRRKYRPPLFPHKPSSGKLQLTAASTRVPASLIKPVFFSTAPSACPPSGRVRAHSCHRDPVPPGQSAGVRYATAALPPLKHQSAFRLPCLAPPLKNGQRHQVRPRIS